jgi:hypothetical protein
MKHLIHHIPPQAIKLHENASSSFKDVPDKMKGYMSMRPKTKNGIKMNYYFVLDNKALKYYDTKKDSFDDELKGVIDFDMYKCTIEGFPQKENAFILNVGNSNIVQLVFQVIPDPETAEKKMQKIKKELAQIKNVNIKRIGKGSTLTPHEM